MDSFHEIDTIKLEKQKAIQRYNTFNKISNILRTLEIFVAISLFFYSVSLSSRYIPAVVEISGALYRRVSSLFFSPHFVFLIGNAIIVTLFAKSSSEKSNSEDSGDDDIFGEAKNASENSGDDVILREAMEDVAPSSADSPVTLEKEFEEKSYRRTKSSVEMAVVKADEKKELRRSVTQVRRETYVGENSPAVETKREKSRSEVVDELSNEEFRKKVEAFIENQQRLLREEKLAVVVSN